MFEKGHKYYPKRDAPLELDGLDKIELGLTKMMDSKDAKERVNAYKLYISLLGKHTRKKTVLEPAVERLVTWLCQLAETNQVTIVSVIKSLTQSSMGFMVFGEGEAIEKQPYSVSLPDSNNLPTTNELSHDDLLSRM